MIVFRLSKRNRYSIVALTAALESRGFEEYEVVSSLEEIFDFDPSSTTVAYSLMTFDVPEVLEEVKILKERGYTLIAGGPHPTADPKGMLDAGFDYVFAGDGEENLLKYIQGERPKSRVFDGLSRRVNLDEYPPFNVWRGMFMPVEISRGCPFRCGYCFTPIIGGGRMRYRSVETVLEYAKKGVEMGRKVARFIASNSFGYMSKNGVEPNLQKIEELLFGLKKVGMEEIYFGTFPSDVRPESVTHEVLRLIKKYVNNRSLIIGAQTGSERVLKIINRGHTIEQVERAIEIATLEGFTPHVDFIFGFPFETDEDVEETFRFIERIVRKYGAKIHAHTFMPLPGTPLAKYGPGRLTRKHLKVLGYLSAKGIVDGYWHKQQELARIAGRFTSSACPSCTSQRPVSPSR